jgi:hypothetical protein
LWHLIISGITGISKEIPDVHFLRRSKIAGFL